MSDTELLPCPFCGGKAIENDYDAIIECSGNSEPCCASNVYTDWNDRSLDAAIAVIEANDMVAVPAEPNGINARERFLMTEWARVYDCYESLDQWLNECIDDAGHTVEQHLCYDANKAMLAAAKE